MSAGAVKPVVVEALPSPSHAAPARPRRLSRAALGSTASTAARLLAILAAAILLRWWIAVGAGVGHASDLSLFVRWIRALTEHGLTGFYAAESFCDYPPLMLLVMRGIGAAVQFVTGGLAAEDLRLGMKLASCAADMIIGATLFLEGRRLLGTSGGMLACGLYVLNPVALYDSAYWGQVDAIYTLFVLGSLVLVLRGHAGWAGALAVVALAAKFQSIAVLPLVVFEGFRRSGWSGLARLAAGGAMALVVLSAPFVYTGTLTESLTRAYVNVVGQYPERSKSAYNLWYLVGDPGESDASPPLALVRLAAGERDAVQAGESWWLHLTWRRISLVLFALSVAVVLSLYGCRPGPLSFYAAAGALALCFFMFPTEMHERYAFPAVAMLAIWGASGAGRERVYWVLTLLLSLNLAAVLTAVPLAPQIAVALFAVLAFVGLGIVVRREAAPAASAASDEPSREARGARPVIRIFQAATLVALTGGVAVGALAAVEVRRLGEWPRPLATEGAASQPGDRPGATTVNLGALKPRKAQQKYKWPAVDRSVDGGLMRIGDTIYLHGVGAHAPATLHYDIPGGMTVFEAVVGINRCTGGRGSAVVRILLDGTTAYVSPTITGTSPPAKIRVPLGSAKSLRIEVDETADGDKCDHVDLALARFLAE